MHSPLSHFQYTLWRQRIKSYDEGKTASNLWKNQNGDTITDMFQYK